MTTSRHRFAFFITPHGYGHAARACAVMNAISERLPGACFEIFTRSPLWFFNMSLQAEFHYHEVLTDLGLVQTTSMDENLPETIRKLEALLPYRAALVQEMARQVRQASCKMVVCDVAPLGILAAREAGLPSVLEENFLWDWIYEGYLDEEPRFAPFISYLHEIFAAAGSHIQTEPVCAYKPGATLLTNPVSRKPRSTPAVTRERLGIPQDAPVALITMGGIATQYPFLHRLESSKDVRFLIPGGAERYEQRGSLVLIPHHSDFYHPDLVEASNVIVGKLGYSTLSEAYAAGLPFAFVPRERFRESPPIGRFAREVMNAVEMEEERFFSGAWLDLLPDLLARPRQKPAGANGADQIAEFVLQKI
jgi:hypothetical protein